MQRLPELKALKPGKKGTNGRVLALKPDQKGTNGRIAMRPAGTHR